MGARRRGDSAHERLAHIWPSFTDVMASIALILFVLVLLAYLRNLIAAKRIDAYEQQISSSEKALRTLSAELSRTRSEIEAGRARLELSEQKLNEQHGIIAASNRELESMRARLSSIALLRVEAVERVRRAIETTIRELGSAAFDPSVAAGAAEPDAPLVHVGDNGNIIISERLVFEYNSFAIRPQGRPLLHTLSQALEAVLDDEQAREYIDVIVVQGHTDQRGSDSFNRDLSAKRASAVLDALFEANRALGHDYGAYFASSAYSEFRPIDGAQTEAAYAKNRRIEIAIVLKDANVRNVIDSYMEKIEPHSVSGDPPQPMQ